MASLLVRYEALMASLIADELFPLLLQVHAESLKSSLEALILFRVTKIF